MFLPSSPPGGAHHIHLSTCDATLCETGGQIRILRCPATNTLLRLTDCVACPLSGQQKCKRLHYCPDCCIADAISRNFRTSVQRIPDCQQMGRGRDMDAGTWGLVGGIVGAV